MDEITFEYFQSWLDEYGRASKENDPRASADLFTSHAEYYETPFAEPKCHVFREWWHTQETNPNVNNIPEVKANKGE